MGDFIHDILRPALPSTISILLLNILQSLHSMQITVNLFGQLIIIVLTIVYLILKIKKLNANETDKKTKI